jgi:hypothetical protein
MVLLLLLVTSGQINQVPTFLRVDHAPFEQLTFLSFALFSSAYFYSPSDLGTKILIKTKTSSDKHSR